MKTRKILFTVLVLGLIAVVGSGPTMAQGPTGVWTSWPFVQNLGSTQVLCNIEFYQEDATTSTPVYTLTNFDIPGDESKLVPVYSMDAELGSTLEQMV